MWSYCVVFVHRQTAEEKVIRGSEYPTKHEARWMMVCWLKATLPAHYLWQLVEAKVFYVTLNNEV